jgi:hypothetical protein
MTSVAGVNYDRPDPVLFPEWEGGRERKKRQGKDEDNKRGPFHVVL